MSTAPFGDRYAVERLGDGGILADLATGSYSRLNRTATAICEELARSNDVEATASGLAARWCIPLAEATAAIGDVLRALDAQGPRRLRPDPFVYGPAPGGDGYLMSNGASPRLWVAHDGRAVRHISSEAVGAEELFHCLRALAPKIFFLQGSGVLHGAACHRANGAVAFCGDSGAGKTTTARAFEAAGARLLSEDMLVVASFSPLTVHLGGEEAIRSWAREEALRLRETTEVRTKGLSAARQGAPVSIDEMWFIAAERRDPSAEALEPRRLGATEGALSVMASVFLGATTPAEWRRFLACAAAISNAGTTLLEARMPEGIERLRRAAKLYTESSAW
jgi:hypothetical protein